MHPPSKPHAAKVGPLKEEQKSLMIIGIIKGSKEIKYTNCALNMNCSKFQYLHDFRYFIARITAQSYYRHSDSLSGEKGGGD